jgi:ABC-type polysaccharide/polyol phosphate transport system ATPase subunit
MLAVSVKNISKSYPVQVSKLDAVRYLISSQRNSNSKRLRWALSNVSFDISSGQCVGIIGRNGSGKSTLLRLIAGISTPTNGQINVNGKLSTVLDVNSGLNPRMTGRQNIFLKGAIYGLKKSDIQKKFQSIIDFSGLDEFIESPINTYSTGMVIRLGFSIAMHMDFDILLMDEVLSIGDVVFQQQCLAKVNNFIKQGKTIILATHSLGDIGAVCDRVIMLNKGCMQFDGHTEKVLQAYWESCEQAQGQIPRHLHPFNPENVYGTDTGEIKIQEVKFVNGSGEEQKDFWTGEPMSVIVRFKCNTPVKDPLFRVQFYRNEGLWVHGANTDRVGFKTGVLIGSGEIILDYERFNLLEGDYYVTVGIWPDEYRSFMTDIAYDCHQWAYVIQVKSKRQDGGGIVSNPFSWRMNNGCTAKAEGTINE